MRCVFPVFVMFFMALATTGCESKKENLKRFYDKLLDQLDALNDAMASIRDQTSAKVAVSKIKEISVKMRELKDNRKVKTSQSITDEVLKECEPRMMRTALKMKAEMDRVSAIPGGKEAVDEVIKARQIWSEK